MQKTFYRALLFVLLFPPGEDEQRGRKKKRFFHALTAKSQPSCPVFRNPSQSPCKQESFLTMGRLSF